MLEYRYKTTQSALRKMVSVLKRIDKAISIDPEVFIKSDWPYLCKKN